MSQFTGKVRWFNPSKGYGFLGRDGGGDVFVHSSAIQNGDFRSMKEGEPVSFDMTHGAQGPQAAQVYRLDRMPGAGRTVDAAEKRFPA